MMLLTKLRPPGTRTRSCFCSPSCSSSYSSSPSSWTISDRSNGSLASRVKRSSRGGFVSSSGREEGTSVEEGKGEEWAAPRSVLLRALRDKSEEPKDVVAAMLELEKIQNSNASSSTSKTPLSPSQVSNREWQIFFSSAIKIEPLQYFPTFETLQYDDEKQETKLFVEFGPLEFLFTGPVLGKF